MSDKTDLSLKDFAGQAEFIAANATANKDGSKHTITRTTTLEHYNENGVTRETLEAVAAADASLLGGLTTFATNTLVDRIRKAREAGEDPTGLKHTVTAATLGGSTAVTVHAKKDRPNRFAKDEKGNPIEGARSIKFGDIDVDIDAEKRIAPGLVTAAAATIEAELNA